MNLWKRLLLCAGLLLLCLPPAARAALSGRLTVSEAAGPRGGTVTVQVSLDQVNGIAGGGFNVVYDNTGLTLLSAEAGLGGGTVNPHYAADTVRLSFAGTAPLQSPGSLLTLTFRIKEGAGGTFFPVRVEGQKFYDVEAGSVPVTPVSGGVSVQAVELSLSSDSCLPGQAVKLELELGGGLYPAGGEFDIAYNTRLLTAGSVKAEQKMGNTALNFSYKIDGAQGVVHVTWAAAEPIGAHGRLCTVIFAVAPDAAGQTHVQVKNMKFYDENGSRVECPAPEDGIVTVVSQYQDQPSLYVVGGKLSEGGSAATVQVAVDGAGVVCGGSFELCYDPALCSLTAMTPKMPCVAVNPEGTDSANGKIAVSWAEDSPALDNETVLELRFQLRGDTPAPLVIGNAVLKDNGGQTIENAAVHSGKAGISSSLQDPVAKLVQAEHTVGIQATLYDAEYCSNTPTGAVQIILAAYADGKMSLVSLPPDAVSFDGNGVAHVSADVHYDPSIHELQMFILDSEGKMTPLCEKVEFSM